MNIKINVRKYMILSLYCGFVLLAMFILHKIDKLDYNEWLKAINLLIVFVMIVQICFIRILRQKIFSISGMFLIFSYIFHLSYQFLIFINYDFKTMFYAIPTLRYGSDVFRAATQYSLMAIIMLFLGMMVAVSKHFNYNIGNIDKVKTSRDNGKLGIMLISVSLPIDIYIIITRLNEMVKYGYSGAVEVSSGTLFSFMTYISYLLLPGIFLYLTSIKDNKKRTRLIAVAYILYRLIGTFTGLRAYAILQILVFIYLYFRSIEKLKTKTLIYGSMIAYLILSWFIVIRNSRSTGIRFSSLLEVFNQNDNIILNSLSEFGFSIDVVCITIVSQVEHIFASQIVYSILTIIPKVSQIFGEYASYNIYNALDLSRYGGSFIADFYFDFGQWGILACLIYGLTIQKISNSIDKLIINKNYYRVALLLPLIVEILFSVRSGTYKIPRIFLWTSLIIVLFKYYLKLIGGKSGYDTKKVC